MTREMLLRVLKKLKAKHNQEWNRIQDEVLRKLENARNELLLSEEPDVEKITKIAREINQLIGRGFLSTQLVGVFRNISNPIIKRIIKEGAEFNGDFEWLKEILTEAQRSRTLRGAGISGITSLLALVNPKYFVHVGESVIGEDLRWCLWGDRTRIVGGNWNINRAVDLLKSLNSAMRQLGISHAVEAGFYLSRFSSRDCPKNGDEVMKHIGDILPKKGQIILYGPPGTGKTYLARKYVIEKTAENNPGNRWEFITFHQSYSYEEFIEGFRPRTNDEGKIQYVVEDGIFKRLALRALVEGLLQREQERQEYESTTTENNIHIYNNCNEECLEKLKTLLTKNEPLSLEEYREYTKLKRYLWNFVRELPREYLSRLTPEFYLIIDEINRGNISKIFGELITLLEKDKRLGEENQLIVTLPYSGEPFAVPPNLHIIGTMNTADRSIALIDVALRRRFAFLEIEPNPEKLDTKIIGNINLKELLEAINKRITVAKDRDHRIGHSYFLKVNTTEDLRKVWYYEVLPLLMEYFYNDWETIKWVLNETGKDSGDVFFEKLNTTGPNGEEAYQVKVLDENAFIAALKRVIGKKNDSTNNNQTTNRDENSTENSRSQNEGD